MREYDVWPGAECEAGQPPTMSIDTTFFKECLDRLEVYCQLLDRDREDETAHRLGREMCIERFEVALEQSGKLLRKTLRPWFASNRAADRLTFRDTFRHAAKRGLIDIEAAERWLSYRDSLNGGGEPDGADPAIVAAVERLPAFVADARALAAVIEQAPDD